MSQANDEQRERVERPGRGNVAEFTVSELAGAIKRSLEDGFGYVRLRGEVSGYRGPHASGHTYFSLKDDKAKIEAVIWRSAWSRIKIKPEEGMEVIAHGRVTTFPNSSKYQIVIEALEPAGVGALMAQIEERKRRLAAEGLFEAGRKRPIPFLPRVVGIITSPTGAVIRDMLHGFEERCPTCVVVWPVRVQGDGSAAEIARAIQGFNAILPGGPVPRPEVLIVARGGGSLEDLWGFNDEAVVRAVAASALPVISAVGHETDWTLIDLVADARAPTPTKAAEWAVPKLSDLIAETGKLKLRLGVGMRRRLEAARRDLRASARALPRPDALVGLPRQRLDGAASRLGAALRHHVQVRHARFLKVAGRMPSLRGIVGTARQRLDGPAQRLDPALRHTVQKRHARLLVAAGRLPSLRGIVGAARQRLDGVGGRLGRALPANASAHRTRLVRTASRLSARALVNRIERGRERTSMLDQRRQAVMARRVASLRQSVDATGKLLETLSYQSVLARGFAVVRDAATGAALRRADGIAAGRRLEIEFDDGRVTADAIATSLVPGSGHVAAGAGPEVAPTETRPRRGKGGTGQGSLF